MPAFKLPLSTDDLVQEIGPWTAFMSPIGSQLRLLNVTIGRSSEPAVEADTLSHVASYGKQLGRIGDALIVLLAHFHPATPLTKEESAAIDDLKDMLQQIADVKDKHKRAAMRPRLHHPHPPDPPRPEPIVSPASPSQATAASVNSGKPPPAPASRRPRRGPSDRPA
jgi:hypothetical protein